VPNVVYYDAALNRHVNRPHSLYSRVVMNILWVGTCDD
jgi:hypothetical protein